MSDPTVLLTGGTGFIGSHTARVFVENGIDVVVTDVTTDDRRLSKLGIADDVAVRQLDLTDATAVVRTVRETDATRIVHLGAVTSLLARADPRMAIDVNVTGTNNVLEAARTLDDQIERVAWSSSMAVYAPAARYADGPVDESALLAPDSIYGATKEFCEHQAAHYAETFDVSTVGLRPTAVYGPFNNPGYLDSEGGDVAANRSPSGRIAGLFARAAQGHPVSMTVQKGAMDWIYVEDVARLFTAAALAPPDGLTCGAYNAASGSVATVEDAAGVLRELLPDAEIELTFEGKSPYLGRIDGSAIWEAVGLTPDYDLREGIRAYVEAIRTDQDLPPLAS